MLKTLLTLLVVIVLLAYGRKWKQISIDYEPYYYTTIQQKMKESMSMNNCTIIGRQTNLVNAADIYVREVPPREAVTNRWGTVGKEKIGGNRLYLRTSEFLCNSKQFDQIRLGHFKFSKGCMELYYVNPRTGEKFKNKLRGGATLHPDHSRCDNHAANAACIEGSHRPALVRQHDRKLYRYPFVVTSNSVIIAKSGMLALPCGPFGLLASCEAVNWGLVGADTEVDNVVACRHNEKSCKLRRFDEVFVMTQYDDTQIGQFILEALPKLVYHLDFILSNPDIPIHFGFTKQPVLPSFVLPHIYFEWLGLRHRLINGTVYANKAIVPREGGCQDASYNAWEVLNQRETFLKMAEVDQSKPIDQPSIVIIKRSASPYTQNQGDHRTRRWPKNALPILIASMQRYFPDHKVEVFSDLDTPLMKCLPCHFRMFHRAAIVIGIHGAGLTNTMYMRPGGVVVELIPDLDSRHSPCTGIFPRLSSIVGLHHYSYYVHGIVVDPRQLAFDTASFAFAVKNLTSGATSRVERAITS